jgi:DNA-binding NarL/FixJ family response regulator
MRYRDRVLRLALIDDHPAVLDALVAQASATDDIRVVGTAREGRTALEMLGRTAPDVVICDVQLPGEPGGLTLLERCGRSGSPAFVMFSAFDTPSLVRAAFERGAAGYLLKSAELGEVLAAVRVVAAGGTAFSSAALHTIRTARRRPSDRELEVIALVAAGATNGEIGLRLGLSEKTVESHLRRLFDRYGLLSRTEVALLAVREGWITDPVETAASAPPVGA